MQRLSLDVISWLDCIWKTELPSASKLIAAYLRSYMNAKHDMAWPSLSRIEKETGLGQSTVCKHIGILESSGWIRRNRGHGGAVTKSTEYIASFPTIWEKAIGSVEVDNGLPSPPNGEASLPYGETLSTKRSNPLHQTDTNIQVNTQVNTQREGTRFKRPISMDWKPDQELLTGLLTRSGTLPNLITDLLVSDFALYWSEEGKAFTESQWIQKLIRQAQAQRVTRITPKPKLERSEQPSDFANQLAAELEAERVAAQRGCG